MGFRKGGEAASVEAKKNSGASFARTHYLSIEDGEQEVLRYLLDKDDWIYCDQHMSVPTKGKPKGSDSKGNWPKQMSATCRYDAAFTKDDDNNDLPRDEWTYQDCYICDAKVQSSYGKDVGKSTRLWALAVLREEVKGTQAMVDAGTIPESKIGKRIGFKDKTREVKVTDKEGKETGETKQEIAVVIVNMAPSNYFDGLTALAATYAGLDEPGICDRDIVVKRSGEGTDTEYHHIALDATDSLGPGKPKWDKYLKAIEEQNLDLEAIVLDRASDDYYGRFFDPNVTVDAKGKVGAKGSSSASEETEGADVEQSSSEPDADRLQAMKDRVRSKAGKAAEVPNNDDVD